MIKIWLCCLVWMVSPISGIQAVASQAEQAEDNALKTAQEDCRKLIYVLRTRYSDEGMLWWVAKGAALMGVQKHQNTILGKCIIPNNYTFIGDMTKRIYAWFSKVHEESLSALRNNMENALQKAADGIILSAIDLDALHQLKEAVQNCSNQKSYEQEVKKFLSSDDLKKYTWEWLRGTTALLVNEAQPILRNQARLVMERTEQTVKMLPKYLYSMDDSTSNEIAGFIQAVKNLTPHAQDQRMPALVAQLQQEGDALIQKATTDRIRQLSFLNSHPLFSVLIQLGQAITEGKLAEKIGHRTFDMLEVCDVLDALVTAFLYERDTKKATASGTDLDTLCTEVKTMADKIKLTCIKLFIIENKKYDECEDIIQRRARNMLRLRQSHDAFKKKENVWILSLDGGGTRGLYGATLLQELEKQTNLQVAHFFDFFAGTSTGGLMSLLLTAPKDVTSLEPAYKTQDLINLYLKESKDIFPTIRTTTAVASTLLYGYKYSPAYLEKRMSDFFNVTRFSLAYKPSLIVTVDDVERKIIPFVSYRPLEELDGSNTPNILKDPYFWQVGRSTSAAPTYFPPTIMQYDGMMRSMIDGGLAQNNPSFEALKEVIKTCPNVKNIHIVSIGTGKISKKRKLGDVGSGIGASLGAVIETQMECSSQSAENNIESIKTSLCNQNGEKITLEHLRIQPELYEEIDLADSSPDSQRYLQYLVDMTTMSDEDRSTHNERHHLAHRDLVQCNQAISSDVLRKLYAFNDTAKAHETFAKAVQVIHDSQKRVDILDQNKLIEDFANNYEVIKQQKHAMFDQAQGRFALSIMLPHFSPENFAMLRQRIAAQKIDEHWLLDSFLLKCCLQDIAMRDAEAVRLQDASSCPPLPRGMELVKRLQYILQSCRLLSNELGRVPQSKVAIKLLNILFGRDPETPVSVLPVAQPLEIACIKETVAICALSFMEANPHNKVELLQLTKVDEGSHLASHQRICREIALKAANITDRS